MAPFDCTLTSQINYKYRIFSFVKFYMESTNQKVWVKYGTGQAVKVSECQALCSDACSCFVSTVNVFMSIFLLFIC
jgi:hypothetical protein